MRIKTEEELLDKRVRAKIIQEIEGAENRSRKHESYVRYRCYKDKTKHYVVELLLRQFDLTTVEEMRYALSNISIVSKVVDKLARVYSNGVERTISDNEEATKRLNDIVKALDVNSALKTANRFLKLNRNVDLFIKPCPVIKDGKTLWTIKLEPLLPHLYDVVEDYYDRTKALCVILSDYRPPATSLLGMDGRRDPSVGIQATPGNGIDETIADSRDDENRDAPRTYVFWSKGYHFTCDQTGEIISNPENPQNKNPLGVFNHINFAIDQDGSFWAEGGDDLIDGAILVNALVTHTVHVGVVQGYGQFYMTGENLPRSIKVGPTKAIIAEYKKDEQAKPEMGFLNASPQLDSLMGLLEMYIALLLTTNNLSTSGVSTQLSGGRDLASGIALILDKAESLEDIQDQRQIFIDKEPDIFEAINNGLMVYTNANLVEELHNLELPKDFKKNFNIKFFDPTPIMSEAEKLANLKLRQELGIDTMISLLMKDDPSLDEKQAEEKLKKLIEQRLKEKLLQDELSQKLGVEYEDGKEDGNEDPEESGQGPGKKGDGQKEDGQDGQKADKEKASQKMMD